MKPLRYENLVVALEANVRALCDFLDLKYEAQLINDVPELATLGNVNDSRYSNV